MDLIQEVNLDEVGKLGAYVYYKKNGEKVKRQYVKPVQPGTPAQTSWWNFFKAGVGYWHGLDQSERDAWITRAKRERLEGYNLFLSAWLRKEFDMLDMILLDDYTGDGTNGRIVDLGEDYDEIHIYLKMTRSPDERHLCEAYAIKDNYGLFWEAEPDGDTLHASGLAADDYFRGKMQGAPDVNKIQLGGTGNARIGTNRTGWIYQIIAKKYKALLPIP